MSIDFSDQDLVSRVRHGDTAAFGDLYAHHSAAAHRAARRIVRDPHVAEDVVSESFARVFKALQGGNGPTGELFPYLVVTMRNVAASWGRESVKWTPVGDDAAFQPRDARDSVAGADELPVDRLNMSLTSSAFETLPRRWRTVLWYLEVEGESATDVGQRLGLSDVAVRQLARRAREGLREAYLAAYLGATPTVGDHVPSADLVSMARGKLSLRRRSAVEKHLDTCPRCSGLLFEAAEENSTLRALALPLYLAAAFAIVKWAQAVGAHLPKIPGKSLARTPVAQAGLAGMTIVAVVTGALTLTPTIGGDKVGTKAAIAQQPGPGNGVVTGSATSASASASVTSTPTASVSVTPTTVPPTIPATAPTTVPTTTFGVPNPTGSSSGVPTSTFGTQLPTAIFPTATTIPLPTTAATSAATSGATSATTASSSTATTAPPTTATTAPTTAPTTTTSAPPPPPALVEADGSLTVGPITTVFTFTITNNGSASIKPKATIVLPAGVNLSVRPQWGCGYKPGMVTLHCSGLKPVAPSATTTYTLLLLGAVSESPTVDVIQPPY